MAAKFGIGYFKSYSIFLELYPHGYMLTEAQHISWIEFAQHVMVETRSLIGMAYLPKTGALVFTFGSQTEANDFKEAWKQARATSIWPLGPWMAPQGENWLASHEAKQNMRDIADQELDEGTE